MTQRNADGDGYEEFTIEDVDCNRVDDLDVKLDDTISELKS